jgi:hypothetical protein
MINELLALALGAGAASANSEPMKDATTSLSLRLVCRGVGDRTVTHVTTASVWGQNGLATDGVGTSQTQDQFGEQMDIDVRNGKAKARVPRRFLPPAHGGQGGWFDVKDLVVSDDAITGTVTINFAQHPKLRVDRRTGSVSMDGKVGSYAGSVRNSIRLPRSMPFNSNSMAT